MPTFSTSPTALYTILDLFKGFEPSEPASFASTPDFQIYFEFVSDGGAASTNKVAVAARAEHDCSILQLLSERLANEKVVAMMGGHGVLRGSAAYAQTANAAAMLTDRDFLVITGGGPGAMEAAHLGAAVGAPGKALDDALAYLGNGITDCSGFPITYDRTATPHGVVIQAKVEELGKYYKTGWDVRQQYPKGGGVAIPTWMYGFEPTTVFAAEIGKYFQNSIREDGLLSAATHGIIYSEGSAGTLQEVFQDAAQNFYRSFPAPAEGGGGIFSPMVFLGDYWRVSDSVRKTLAVRDILDALWRKMKNGPTPADLLVQYVDTPADAVAVIEAFKGQPLSSAKAVMNVAGLH